MLAKHSTFSLCTFTKSWTKFTLNTIHFFIYFSAWVELSQVKRSFWTNPPSKKIQSNTTHHISPSQPNPTHMGQVGSGWTHGLDKFFFFIIIKLSRKKYKYKYIKKTQRLVSIWLLKGKQHYWLNHNSNLLEFVWTNWLLYKIGRASYLKKIY